MTIKIIWALIGLNILGLLIFISAYFVLNSGKNVSSMEQGWTAILAGVGLVVILLAALPLRISQSTFAQIFSGIFAALPSVIALGIFISNRLPSLKSTQTFAKTYYSDKTQRKIATAIEQNDTVLLKELIKGQDLNIQGNRVWDWDGLNYLQFAVRIRSNPISFPFDDNGNTAAIRILIENGSKTTPALVDAVSDLPAKTLVLLLDAGADPNVKSDYTGDPVLFSTIAADSDKIDKAILLVQKGADVNATNSEGLTPAMFLANRAQTYDNWKDTWRFLYFLLSEAKADYLYKAKDGRTLQSMIREIRVAAAADNFMMPEDFLKIVKWLKEHQVNTDPVLN